MTPHRLDDARGFESSWFTELTGGDAGLVKG